jgi:RNA polymerase sigma-70 factor (ECF subfamily)
MEAALAMHRIHPDAWAERLLGRLPSDSAMRGELAGVVDLEERVVDVLARARAAWPELSVDDDLFLTHLSRALLATWGTGHQAASRVLDELHIEDLYLACGCVNGVAQALRAFERTIMPHADHALRRLDHTGTLVDEAKQRLREKLLVKDGDRAPRLATFHGSGDLIGFIKVAATRTGLDVLRREKRDKTTGEDELLERLASPGDDQHVLQQKVSYRAAFRAAFQEALAALTPRDRLLLRQSVLDGLSIDDLSALHGVHRATAARWLQRTREELLKTTERALREKIELDDEGLPELFHMVQSQLDVSLPRMLHVPRDDAG